MASIPEDSVLRRHYLASAARRQAAGGPPPASRPTAPSAVAPGPASAPRPGGILGFIKRLFGA